MIRKFITYCIFIFSLSNLSAQSLIEFNIGTIAYHPFGDKNASLFENSLNYENTFVLEPIFAFSYETFIREDYSSIEFMQGFLSDKGAYFSGFTYMGYKRRVFHKWKHFFYLGLGPNLSYRETWTKDANWIDDKTYFGLGDWQRKWTFCAQLEYNYVLKDKSDFVAKVLYGHYYNTFTFTFGYRYWINTAIKHMKPCNCPFDKYNKKRSKSRRR